MHSWRCTRLELSSIFVQRKVVVIFLSFSRGMKTFLTHSYDRHEGREGLPIDKSFPTSALETVGQTFIRCIFRVIDFFCYCFSLHLQLF